MSDWTQPICDDCWPECYPGMEPTRLLQPEQERCCYCGKDTLSGIYTRVDPAHVPYPTLEEL